MLAKPYLHSSSILISRRLRAVVAADVTTAVTQAPAVTTLWMQSQVNPTSVTYVEVIYTQTFAKVPDQWPSPGSGTIGLGTLTKEKRDAAPTGTGGKKGKRFVGR